MTNVPFFVLVVLYVLTAQASDWGFVSQKYAKGEKPATDGRLILLLREEVYRQYVSENGDRLKAPTLTGATEVRWLLEYPELVKVPKKFRRAIVADFGQSYMFPGLSEKSNARKTLLIARNYFSAVAESVEPNGLAELVEPSGGEQPLQMAATNQFPNDPLFVGQDYMTRIKAPRLWSQYLQGPSTFYASCQKIRVVIIDSGIQASHPDLPPISLDSRTFFPGQDPLTDPSTTTYPQGHGTLVAGIIGARGNNSLGIAGINWTADLISFQIYKSISTGGGKTTLATGYEEILKAFLALHQVTGNLVVNASLAYDNLDNETLSLWKEVIKSLEDKVLFVVAAGNSGDSTTQYPGAFSIELENVISVASEGPDGRISSFSTLGKQAQLAAMGENILSTSSNGAYSTASGTSLSAPQVTGVASSIWQTAANATPSQLKKALIAGAAFNPRLADAIANPLELNASGSMTTLEQMLAQKPTLPSMVLAAVVPAIPSKTLALARGALVTVWGEGFTGGEEFSYSSLPFPKRLGNLEVQLNGFPIPIMYVGSTQINVHLPMDQFRFWPGENQISVVRYDQNGDSQSWAIMPQKFRAVETNPGLIMEQNGNPHVERTDEGLKIFATGLGVTAPEISAGDVARKGELVRANVTALVDGQDMSATAKASAWFPGLYEIFLPLPPEATEVTIRLDGWESTFSLQ